MPEALVEARVDSEVAARATTVLKEAGLSLSDAISLLLTRIANEGALPFSTEDDSEEYDKWFRAQVQEALDDPRPPIPNEEVKARFARLRSELLA